MAVGDLITTYQQREFNGLLLGSFTDYICAKVEGELGKSDVKTTDMTRQDAWGDFPGRDMYHGRKLILTLDIDNQLAPIETNIANLETAWAIPDQSPPAAQYQYVFNRNWPVAGKRFYWGRPGRMVITSDTELAHGLAHAVAEIKVSDPRSYSLVEYTDVYTIPNAGSTVSAYTTTLGDTATAPILDITGPCTNPIIQNVTDNAKQFKMSITLLATDVLEIDFRQRLITKNGIDAYINMTLDSQWWKLRPGANQIVYTRQGAGASSTMNLRYRNAWS